MKYNVIVQTDGKHDTYKVYSHRLENYCLVLNFGRLEKSKAPEEIAIPVFTFDLFYTEDIDEA